jgi:FR47-like protein
MNETVPLLAGSIAGADAFWAKEFALDPSGLRPTETLVRIHGGGLSGNPGISILACGGAPLVSMPPHVFELLHASASSWSLQDVADPHALARLLFPLGPDAITAILGPAFLGYAPTALPPGNDETSQLDASQSELITQLREACPVENWEHGGPHADTIAQFGSFDSSGQLAALASYNLWDNVLAHIAIVTHPKFRGSGHGCAAVAHAARHAMAAGHLAQYRTLRANLPSMSIAKRLGFQEYGFSTYVRLSAARS